MSCARCSCGHPTHVVATTQYFVSNLIALTNIANDNLLTFSDHHAIYGSGIVGGAGASPTESFDLESIDAIC